MQKPLIVPLACVIVLTGCSAFKTSQTWKRVVENRPDRIAAGTGKSTYSDRLHAVLTEQKVEHKVVTYQFRYQTRQREEAVGAGRAVIYRDSATPDSPWWVMDETTGFPVWVPNESPDRQLSFFLQRNAEVIAQQDYPGGSSGKSFDTAPALAAPPVSAASPAMLAKARKPAPALVAAAKAKPAAPALVATAPAAVDSPATRSEWLSSVDRRFDEMFRATHGTAFDRKSSADREKMVELRHTVALRDAQG